MTDFGKVADDSAPHVDEALNSAMKSVTEISDAAGLRETLWNATLKVFGGNLTIFLLQGMQFAFLPRFLGADQFGRIAAVTAMVAIVIPLTDFGFGTLLVRHCNRDRQLAASEFSVALGATLIGGVALVLVLLPAARLVYGPRSSVLLVLLIGYSELICFRCVWVCSQLHLAFDRFGRSSTLIALPGVCRILALALPMFVPGLLAVGWAIALASLATVLAAATLFETIGRVGFAPFSFKRMRVQFGEAIHYSLGTVALCAYTDLDKVFMGRYGSPAELGAYTAAYRIMAMAFIPVRSMLQASMNRFFRAGNEGLRSALVLSSRLLRLFVPYGAICAVCLYVGAPKVPLVLGASFKASVPMLRFLVIVPVIQSIQYSYSAAFTGAGLQGLRTTLQFIVVGIYGIVAAILVPRYGWRGAALTCITGEALLAIMIRVAAFILRHHRSGAISVE